MIAYVETNFILELAFLRDEHDACVRLLDLATTKSIRLALPAFSIGESYDSSIRRWKQRKELQDKLQTEVKELARSKPYADSAENLQSLIQFFAASAGEEKSRLDETLDLVLNTVEIIPVDLQTIGTAVRLQQSHNLSPQDSIIFASILIRLPTLGEEKGCFITTNSNDFATSEVIEDLAGYNCKLLTRFNDGQGYVRSQIALPSN